MGERGGMKENRSAPKTERLHFTVELKARELREKSYFIKKGFSRLMGCTS